MYVLELAGEDDEFAVAEAGTAADGVSVAAPGVATASTLSRTRFRHLAFTRRASELVAETDATQAAAEAALEAALEATDMERSGPLAVRGRDVRGTAGIDTQEAERRLGQVLVDRGAEIDLDAPANVLVALFAGESAFLGWEVATTTRAFGSRAPTDRPFFQPGSMDPQLARAVVNLADVVPGDLVLDPMCGTGGLLIEAGLIGAQPLGFDAQRHMVEGARENLREFLEETDSPGPMADFALANASTLPLGDRSVDAVVFDAPYGRQSKIASDSLQELVAGSLAEAGRVASRAVLVADRSYETAAEDASWTVAGVYKRRVHRSLTRYVHVLDGESTTA